MSSITPGRKLLSTTSQRWTSCRNTALASGWRRSKVSDLLLRLKVAKYKE